MALDIGVGNDQGLGWLIFDLARDDSRCKYVIFRGKGQRATWRGGSTFRASGHMTHVHVSFNPAAWGNTNSWFGGVVEPEPEPEPPPEEVPIPMASTANRKLGDVWELNYVWAKNDGTLRHARYTKHSGWVVSSFGDLVNPDRPIALSVYPEQGDPSIPHDDELHVAAVKQDGSLYHSWHSAKWNTWGIDRWA
jgi:hypothetical protein|tara:strand:+ start:798 stop:1376 length:579 start_codon:yes stop_codon:yes gene_type:complete